MIHTKFIAISNYVSNYMPLFHHLWNQDNKQNPIRKVSAIIKTFVADIEIGFNYAFIHSGVINRFTAFCAVKGMENKRAFWTEDLENKRGSN